ncbi:hypothetical protein O185_12500 [Photorhabdus temperata J3]|uniref:Uncharacterized protein n=1 Tax=Photorhabdus temperata J3 TaxID=1389415 RepID=U7R297_PHOTE|nr:hypothetical protein O185_12500 [Photorhabdus temperata J3]
MNAFWVINQQKISIVLVLPTQKLHQAYPKQDIFLQGG